MKLFHIESHTLLLVLTMTFTAMGGMFVISSHFSSIGTDGVFYANMAKSLTEGGGLNVYGVPHTVYSPLLPLSIAPLLLVGLEIEFAAHLAVIIFATLSLFLVYFLGQKIHSTRVGVLASLFLACNGVYLWTAANSVSPQFLGGFFTLLALLFLLEIEKQIPTKIIPRIILLSISLGLAYLARPEYFFLAPPLMIWLFYVLRPTRGLRNAALSSLLGFSVFFAVCAPYLVYLHQTLGYWTISGRGNELAMIVTAEHYENVDTAMGSSAASVVEPPSLSQGGMALVLRDIPAAMKHLADGLINTEHTFLRLFGLLGVLFFGFGLRHLLFVQKIRILTLSALFSLPVVLVAFAQGGSPNYIVQYFYLITPIIGVGVVEFIRECSQYFLWSIKNTRWIFAILTAVLSLYFIFPAMQNILFLPKDYRDVEYKNIGMWMQSHIPNIEKEVVLSRKPEPTFYAGSLWALVPNAHSAEELHSLMLERKQRYIIVDDRNFPAARPMLLEMLDPEKIEAHFTLVHSEDYFGKRAMLYEVK